MWSSIDGIWGGVVEENMNYESQTFRMQWEDPHGLARDIQSQRGLRDRPPYSSASLVFSLSKSVRVCEVSHGKGDVVHWGELIL